MAYNPDTRLIYEMKMLTLKYKEAINIEAKFSTTFLKNTIISLLSFVICLIVSTISIYYKNFNLVYIISILVYILGTLISNIAVFRLTIKYLKWNELKATIYADIYGDNFKIKDPGFEYVQSNVESLYKIIGRFEFALNVISIIPILLIIENLIISFILIMTAI